MCCLPLLVVVRVGVSRETFGGCVMWEWFHVKRKFGGCAMREWFHVKHRTREHSRFRQRSGEDEGSAGLLETVEGWKKLRGDYVT